MGEASGLGSVNLKVGNSTVPAFAFDRGKITKFLSGVYAKQDRNKILEFRVFYLHLYLLESK